MMNRAYGPRAMRNRISLLVAYTHYIYIYVYVACRRRTDQSNVTKRDLSVFYIYIYLLMSMYINERRLLLRVSGLCSVVVYLVGRFD